VARRSSSKRKVARVAVFLAILGAGLLVVLMALSARRSRFRRASTPLKTPAGGAAAASANPDGATSPDAIVEDARRYPVKSWAFSLDRYEMRIEDANMTMSLDTLLKKTESDLVVNAGFFDPDGKPVGLAMSDGAIVSRLKSNLSGGILTTDGLRARLSPTEGFSLVDGGGGSENVKFAVQCRPRLVVDREANVKSDDGKRAERTALCIREEGARVDVIVALRSDDGESPGPSLFALAKHLTEVMSCDAALNLDGGPSTGVAWRSPGEGDNVHLLPPRGPVRLAIAFREKR